VDEDWPSADFALAGGRLLAVCNATIELWELSSGKKRRALPTTDKDTTILARSRYPSAALAANGRLLALPHEAGIALVDVVAGRGVRSCAGLSAITDVALSADGRLLAASGKEGACLWETATGTLLARLHGHRGPVTTVAFAAGGSTLATGGEDSTVLVWDLPAPGCRRPSAPGSGKSLRPATPALPSAQCGVWPTTPTGRVPCCASD
jgi:WD40 repeat protein